MGLIGESTHPEQGLSFFTPLSAIDSTRVNGPIVAPSTPRNLMQEWRNQHQLSRPRPLRRLARGTCTTPSPVSTITTIPRLILTSIPIYRVSMMMLSPPISALSLIKQAMPICSEPAMPSRNPMISQDFKRFAHTCLHPPLDDLRTTSSRLGSLVSLCRARRRRYEVLSSRMSTRTCNGMTAYHKCLSRLGWRSRMAISPI